MKVHSNQSRHADWIGVRVEHGMLRAQVIRAKLEEAGIPVLLDYESVGQIIGIMVDGLAEVRVLVPPQYVDEARALIESPEEEEAEQ